MTALSNQRQERFAQLLFLGKTQIEAYTEAGYKPDDGAAARLSGNVRIKARLAELQAKQLARIEITADRVLKELAKIGFADIRKAINWQANVVGMVEGEDGEQRLAVTNQVCIVDSAKLDDDTAAAVAEIAQTDKGGLKIKLHDKLGALTQIGRHLGMFANDGPNVQVNLMQQFVGGPPEETREEWIARKQREREARLAAPADERAR